MLIISSHDRGRPPVLIVLAFCPPQRHDKDDQVFWTFDAAECIKRRHLRGKEQKVGFFSPRDLKKRSPGTNLQQ